MPWLVNFLTLKKTEKQNCKYVLITEGKQTKLRDKVLKGGYTVWKMKNANPTPIHVADLDKAVVADLDKAVAECLR
jgi:hypothetical protein